MQVSQKREYYKAGYAEDIYYHRVFDFLESGKVVSWNWMAFFFKSVWMVYRKMYLFALAAQFLLFWPLGEKSWLLLLFTGLFANRFYYSWLSLRVKAQASYKSNVDPFGVGLLMLCFAFQEQISEKILFLKGVPLMSWPNLLLESLSFNYLFSDLLITFLSAFSFVYFLIHVILDVKILITGASESS